MTLRLDDKVIVTGALVYVGGPVTTNTKGRPGAVQALDAGPFKDRVDVLLDGVGRHRVVRARYENVRRVEA